jgi:hypothetical protein
MVPPQTVLLAVPGKHWPYCHHECGVLVLLTASSHARGVGHGRTRSLSRSCRASSAAQLPDVRAPRPPRRAPWPRTPPPLPELMLRARMAPATSRYQTDWPISCVALPVSAAHDRTNTEPEPHTEKHQGTVPARRRSNGSLTPGRSDGLHSSWRHFVLPPA